MHVELVQSYIIKGEIIYRIPEHAMNTLVRLKTV